MATDSTELTFVRCPSCRSLVPAVSTRCRMCGATLDSGAEAAGQEKESGTQKSGRVRQRTVSQPKNELNQAVNRIREEEGVLEEPIAEPTSKPAARAATEAVLAAAADLEPSAESRPASIASTPPAAAVSASPVTEKIDEELDPLSGYVEEVALDDDALDDLGDDDDLMDDLLDEPSASPMKAKEPSAPIKVASPPEPRPESPRAERPMSPPINGRPSTPKAPDSSADSPAPRVRVESGSRSGGLSFSPKPKWEESVKEESESSRELENRRRDEGKTSPASPSARQAIKPPTVGNVGAGRLVGWFVSFSTPTGVSTELREGKFFVSRTQLKPSDYVIDHPSVSTPHAMVSVAAGGVQVQDLLSEKGIMVRRRGQGGFQKAQDSVELGHGDAIRFGEVEYLICLISE